MPRTTLDLDAGVLRDLKRRRQATGQSIGRIASDLLAAAMRTSKPGSRQPMQWKSASMGARLDLDDKEAVRRALDGA